MNQPLVEELLSLNQKLLDSVASGDWAAYQALCDPTLSAFEPEALGRYVEGMSFHRFYFDLQREGQSHNVTMASPQVRLLGGDETAVVAVVAYIRLIQQVDEQGRPFTTAFEETRIWEKQAEGWRHVHFHRSGNQAASQSSD